MTIFLVKSNLKIDGDNFLAGSFIEGDTGRFSTLISDKVIEEVNGAETIEKAKQLVAKRDAEIAAEAEIAEETKPQNTWGPTKKEDETPAETTPETPAETETKEEVTTETKVTNTPADSAETPAETTPPADETGDNL